MSYYIIITIVVYDALIEFNDILNKLVYNINHIQ